MKSSTGGRPPDMRAVDRWGTTARGRGRTQVKPKQRGKTIQTWKGASRLLEYWRKSLTPLTVELKQPRMADAIAIDFGSGEPIERMAAPTTEFKRQLIYYTSADLTIRRLSGAILVVDRYELIAISDRKTRLEPR